MGLRPANYITSTFACLAIVISDKFATFVFTCKPCPGRGYSDDQYLKVLHFLVKRLYIAVDGFEIDVPSLRREDLGIAPTDVIFYTAQSGYKRHPDNKVVRL